MPVLPSGSRCIKVVIIGPSPRFLSGISYYTCRLSNALAVRNTVISVLFRHMLPQRLFPGWRRVGQNLSSLKPDSGVKVAEILDWFNPVTWIYASRIVRSADVVILEWWTSSVAHMYLALLIVNRSKTPVMIEFHEVVDPLEFSVGPIRIYARVMGRLIRSMADRYVVHSMHDRKLIASHYHIPEEQISVIPHGLYDQYPVLGREDVRASLSLDDGFVFLFFGLIRPYKGVQYLIQAFEQLPDVIKSQAHLLIVGEAWEDSDSVHHATTSSDAVRIHLVNRYVSDDEVPVFFSAADALVLPYTRASQSGVAHIGISYGLAVVSSQVGGLAESLAGYAGTTFVHPGDVHELSQALETVYHAGHVRYPVPGELRWESVATVYEQEMGQMVKDIS